MTTIGTPHSSTPAPSISTSTRRWRASVVGAAALLALLTWLVANLVDASPVRVRMQDQVTTISGIAVVIVSAVAALAGWALLAVLERVSRSGRRIWTGIAVVVLVLSLSAPLSYGIGAAAKWSLAALHVVTGVVVIVGFGRSSARS